MTATQPKAERFDAIVVGGGPAGSTAARRLALAGAHTLLLEKAHHPRYKACGGGVPLRTMRHIDLPLDDLIEDEIRSIEITHFGKRRFIKQSAQPFAYTVMRDRFDQRLLAGAEEAGAEIQQSSPVLALELDSTLAHVKTETGSYEAPYLLAADGSTGPIARWAKLGGGIRRSAAYELEISAPATSLQRWTGSANVDVGYRPWGYGWVFPKRGRLSVGVVLSPGHGNKIKQLSQRYVERLGLPGTTVTTAVGHPIRYRRSRHETIARGPVLALGDAAGLADEFTAEGIAYAVHSGALAARAIDRATGSAAASYQSAVNDAIQPELDAARAISRLYYRCVTAWPALALAVSKRIDYFWHAFFRVMRGDASYDSELNRWPLLKLSTKIL